jgi:cupin 2 domain-containing protein
VSDAANILTSVPYELSEESFQTLLAGTRFRVERIVSHGHATADEEWYDQDEHEWVLLVTGAARLRFDGDEPTIEMMPGSFVNIPAHKRHRVEWTDPSQPTIWLAIHYQGTS